jgi:G2/mitotic-specific cyclin 1/2
LRKLQLVGTKALFIATNLVALAEDNYPAQEIIGVERYMLQVKKFFPNPMNFFRRISKADTYDIRTRTIGKYFMEIPLIDHRFLPLPLSLVAAIAMYVSRT